MAGGADPPPDFHHYRPCPDGARGSPPPHPHPSALPPPPAVPPAGLPSPPQDTHAAAAVDGAGFWRRHFQITAPLILPITLVAVLFGIIFTFTDMIVVFVLTRGGPYDSTQVIASWAYFTGIQGGDLAGGA